MENGHLREPADRGAAPASCLCHGTPFNQLEFRDSSSLREFMSTRLCQQTQDNLFNPEHM